MNEYALRLQDSLISKKSFDSRYYFTQQIIDSNNNILYNLFQGVDYTNYSGFIYHIVEPGEKDRLDIVAYEYYQDSSYWWLIAMVNNIIDPFILVPGTQLKIPSIGSFMIGGVNSVV